MLFLFKLNCLSVGLHDSSLWTVMTKCHQCSHQEPPGCQLLSDANTCRQFPLLGDLIQTYVNNLVTSQVILGNYSGECQYNTLLIALGQLSAGISCRYRFLKVLMTAQSENFSPSACLSFWCQQLFFAQNSHGTTRFLLSKDMQPVKKV